MTEQEMGAGVNADMEEIKPMNIAEAFDVLHEQMMLRQRFAAQDVLQAEVYPPEGVAYGFVVIPAEWKSNPPPECVVQALAACGFDFRWVSFAPAAPLLLLLRREAPDAVRAALPEGGRKDGSFEPARD